jgi:hypothetical protein
MTTQHQIKRTLSTPEAVDVIRRMLAAHPTLKRGPLADRLCDQYGFLDGRGHRQRSGCVKALRTLEAQGQLVLPTRRGKRTVPRPRRLDGPVPEPQAVPGEVTALSGLQLVRVDTPAQMRIWNELMLREHPLGAGPLVGRQVRYLVGSGHGWLGALGFGAAALHLRDRDRWIGWETAQRGAHLDKVVNLGRFLIRPSVRCANLASHVLGRCVQALPADFEERFGYRPYLLETFVDPTHYSGTCFRAANWLYVGRTQGRGRQDREMKAAKSRKDIYVYPLVADFRARLGLAPGAGLVPLGPAAGLQEETWAEQEFGAAPLGDRRLSRRLVDIARAKAHRPGQPWTGVARGDWPATKAYYRLIDQPRDSAVTMAAILQPHRERTLQRMKAQRIVLCLNDGTDLNFSTLRQCEGLGLIGTNQTGAKSRGLHLHSTLAVTPEGLPLGLLRAQCTAPGVAPTHTPLETRKRPPRTAGKRTAKRPLEQRKTFCWLEAVRDCRHLARFMPQTRLISVMDREADFFELFDDWRQDPSVELLVRARHDRRTTEGAKLFAAVRKTAIRCRLQLPIPRHSARPKKGKQPTRAASPARVAQMALRYAQVQLQPPDSLGQQGKAPVPVWILHLVEENPPPGVTALEWFLLTTVELRSVEQAIACVRWYCLRWRIEDWHRVLKSGCRVEAAAHDTADRLRRAIAINLVVAWRIMLLTLLGREAPELPPDVLFSDLEIEVLQRYAKKTA